MNVFCPRRLSVILVAAGCLMGGCGMQDPAALFDRSPADVLGAPLARDVVPTVGLPPQSVEPDSAQSPWPADVVNRPTIPNQRWPEPVPEPAPDQEPSPFGLWVLDFGTLAPDFVPGADVTGLAINDQGFGRVFLNDRETNANDCVRAFALFDGNTLVMDFSAEASLSLLANRTFVFPVVVFDEQTLGLADAEGQIAWFTRQTAMPDALTCDQLPEVDRFNHLPAQNFFSDLVHYAGDLMYNSQANNQIERFDLASNSMDVPLAPTNNRYLQTVQGIHFWTHCACGGSPDATRRSLTTVFDTVSSQTELGGFITIRAMAFETTTTHLWIHGRAQSTGRANFTVVNTAVEPDQVIRSIPFNRDLRALAFDGADMWGLVTVATQSIVRISVVTGQVIESFEVPDENVAWGGLVFDEAHMYLLGTDTAGEGVIVQVER